MFFTFSLELRKARQLNGDFTTCVTMTVAIYVILEPVTFDLSSQSTGAKVMEPPKDRQKRRTWEVPCMDDILLNK